MTLQDEKYMALTTFRKDGTPVVTPVWVADLGDGTVGFWTSSGSGKAKRLRHTSRVIVQASDGRGKTKPGSQPIETQARLVTGADHEAVRQKIVAKYGWQTKMTKVVAQVIQTARGKKIPYGDVAVIVDLPRG